MNPKVAELNKKFAQVTIGGKLRYYDGDTFYSRPDFISLLAGETIKRGEKLVPISKIWLNWKGRKVYKHVTFYPGPVPNDTLNFWKGFPVKPVQGDWSLFRKHIFQNICRKNEAYETWLIDWMADIIQHPETKQGTALVIYGDKGTGKSFFSQVFSHLIPGSIELNDAQEVMGRFNLKYEQSLLVYADEAIFAGDHKAQSKLKNLVTTSKLWIERKGLEGYSAPNFTRLVLTTNEGWAVSASNDERRYFVLKTSNDWQQNDEKFAQVMEQMENGGYEALMYDLAHREIKSNLRKPPHTEFLDEQIDAGRPIIEKFLIWWKQEKEDQWDHIMRYGYDKARFFGDYCDFVKGIKGGGRLPSVFWKEVKKHWDIRETRPTNEQGFRVKTIFFETCQTIPLPLKNPKATSSFKIEGVFKQTDLL